MNRDDLKEGLHAAEATLKHLGWGGIVLLCWTVVCCFCSRWPQELVARYAMVGWLTFLGIAVAWLLIIALQAWIARRRAPSADIELARPPKSPTEAAQTPPAVRN